LRSLKNVSWFAVAVCFSPRIWSMEILFMLFVGSVLALVSLVVALLLFVAVGPRGNGRGTPAAKRQIPL
jgi:hypothetical protein